MTQSLIDKLTNANITSQDGFDQFVSGLLADPQTSQDYETLKQGIKDLHENFIANNIDLSLVQAPLISVLNTINDSVGGNLTIKEPDPDADPNQTKTPLQIALDKIEALDKDSEKIIKEAQERRDAINAKMSIITDTAQKARAEQALDNANANINDMVTARDALLQDIQDAKQASGAIASNDPAAIESFISSTLAPHKQTWDAEHAQFKGEMDAIDGIIKPIVKAQNEAEAAKRAAENAKEWNQFWDKSSATSKDFFNQGLLGQMNGAAGSSDVGNVLKHSGYVGAGLLREAWGWAGDAWNFMNNKESLGGWAPVISQGLAGFAAAAVLKRTIIDPFINATFGKIPLIGGLFKGIVAPILSLVGGLIGGSAILGAIQNNMDVNKGVGQNAAAFFSPSAAKTEVSAIRTTTHDGTEVKVSAVAPTPEGTKELNAVIAGTEESVASASSAAMQGSNPKWAMAAANIDLGVAAKSGNQDFTLASFSAADNDNMNIIIQTVPHNSSSLETASVSLRKGQDGFYAPAADNNNLNLHQAPMIG